ncbi:MAG: hypothetical protein J6Y32_06600 [Bacteroidales bacterium]|nr:hypothetical protein [Bacteroidales bacterium]
MKKTIFCFSALLLTCALSAQSLDPTVRVTGTYRGSVATDDLPQEEIALPDSVAVFDTRFDYSVFDKPYKGSYEFMPYLPDLRPQKQKSRRNQLYLRAGAGFTLHPELDFCWEPEVGDSSLNLSIYANNRSYLGRYQAFIWDINQEFDCKDGFESLTHAGVRGRYDFENVYLHWDAAYKGFHGDDGNMQVRTFDNRGFNMASADLGLRSSAYQTGKVYFSLDLGIDYARANENFGELRYVDNGNASLRGKVGDMISANHGFEFDFKLAMLLMRSPGNLPLYNSTAELFSITPRYRLDLEKFKLDLGANIAYVANDKQTWNYRSRQQIIYPDVKISYDPWRRWATFFLKVTGGIHPNTYEDMLNLNPHFCNAYTGGGALLDNTVENLRLALGVEGKIASRFTYDLTLGYRICGSTPVEMLSVSSIPDLWRPDMGFTSLRSLFGTIGASYRAEFLDIQAHLLLQKAYGLNNNQQNLAYFDLPPFVLDFRAVYNWKRRIFVGVSLDAQGGRLAVWKDDAENQYMAGIRPFWNLGAQLSYVISPEWTVWVKGENLLFQPVQRYVGYAQKGAWGSVGITLNIR